MAGAELGALIVAGVAIYVTLRGLRNQLWLQMLSEYTRRYSAIVADLPSSARQPGASFDASDLPSDQHDQLLNSVRAYLNLCAEEFFL